MFRVANTGGMDGTEILQIYVRKKNDVDGPLKTLKGFKRVTLEAGQSGITTIELPLESFEFYNRELRRMAVVSGEYEVFYGNSSSRSDLKMQSVTIL